MLQPENVNMADTLTYLCISILKTIITVFVLQSNPTNRHFYRPGKINITISELLRKQSLGDIETGIMGTFQTTYLYTQLKLCKQL